MIPVEVKRKIQQAAVKAYPNEMCGFVVDNDFIEVENTDSNPTESFSVTGKVWSEFEHTCTAFIHSHPDWYACPSERDMKQQAATGVPWGIVATNGEAASNINFFGDQLPIPDLNNRPFIHGITDCYSAIRHWYKLERDIWLKEFPRSWEWWLDPDKDLYKDNFEVAGFYKLPYDQTMEEGPQPGDVFLASVGNQSQVKGKFNHGGVYTGNGLAYHHLSSNTTPVDISRLAKPDPVHRWSKYIRAWLRYKE